ncbi:hypothetical protein EZS27_009364 [termite gut metagenome]|uniref:Uncharacterized protein n=1 Tax=termite gut metagenome TaxID=433724 RepID=A0A5J4S9X0_9ZZZZ
METSFKVGDKVTVKGEKGTAEIVKIYPYGIIEVEMSDGTAKNVRTHELNKIK